MIFKAASGQFSGFRTAPVKDIYIIPAFYQILSNGKPNSIASTNNQSFLQVLSSTKKLTFYFSGNLILLIG